MDVSRFSSVAQHEPGLEFRQEVGMMGDESRRRRIGLYGAVVAAVLVVGAGGVLLAAVHGSTNRSHSRATSAERPKPDQPPDEWPPMDTATAASVTAYLNGPGAVLVPLTEHSTELFEVGADQKHCIDTADGFEGIDANAALTAAAEVPDVPLQHMYVNLTGQISRLLGLCADRAAATDLDAAREDLATLNRYIAVRLDQVEEAL